MKAIELVQGQFKAYNDFDLDKFCSYFHNEIKVRTLTSDKYSIDGKESFREFYSNVFAKFPKQNTVLISRTETDEAIYDYEIIFGRPNCDQGLKGVVIFAFRDNLIDRVWI